MAWVSGEERSEYASGSLLVSCSNALSPDVASKGHVGSTLGSLWDDLSSFWICTWVACSRWTQTVWRTSDGQETWAFWEWIKIYNFLVHNQVGGGGPGQFANPLTLLLWGLKWVCFVHSKCVELFGATLGFASWSLQGCDFLNCMAHITYVKGYGGIWFLKMLTETQQLLIISHH